MTSKAAQRAVYKYKRAHYDTLSCLVPKGAREQIKTHAAAAGLSLNSWVNKAIINQMILDDTAD